MDADLVFGGIAAAGQIRHNFAFPLQPTNEDILLEAAKTESHMDFFSYHSITTSPTADQIQVAFIRKADMFCIYWLREDL